MTILSLNRVVGLILKVSLNVMTAVINKTNNEISVAPILIVSFKMLVYFNRGSRHEKLNLILQPEK